MRKRFIKRNEKKTEVEGELSSPDDIRGGMIISRTEEASVDGTADDRNLENEAQLACGFSESVRQSASQSPEVCNRQATVRKSMNTKFISGVEKLAGQCDDRLEYFRQSVSEMLDSVSATVSRMVSRTHTRLRAVRRVHDRSVREGWIERRMIVREKRSKRIMEGQFADIAVAVASFERRFILKLDAIRAQCSRAFKMYERIVDRVAQFYIVHRKGCTVAMGTAMTVMAAFVITINAATVYDYSYHGTQLGTVKNKTEIEEAVTQVPEAMDSNVSVTVDPRVDVTYTKQLNFSADTDTAETAADKIANAGNLTGDGFALVVDGKTAALVDSEETANEIIRNVKLYYCTVDGEGHKVVDGVVVNPEEAAAANVSTTSTEADFAADLNKVTALHTIVDLEDEFTDDNTYLLDDASNEDDAVETASDTTAASADMTASTEAPETTEAIEPAAGEPTMASDSLATDAWTVPDSSEETTDISSQQLAESTDGTILTPEEQAIDEASAVLTAGKELGDAGHPLVFSVDVAPDDLIFDEEVTIEPVVANVDAFSDYDAASKIFINEDGSSKLLTVATNEIQVFTKTMPFETVYEDNPDMYEDEVELAVQGVDGKARVTAKISRINGEEVDREILSQTEYIPPVNQVIVRGTKVRPKTDSTGLFVMPTTGRFSSGFGARWGRQHKGVDIAAPYGTDVVAADGGTVVYAQFNNHGYGNLVKINHGNGYETYYAHNSSLLVSVGDKVAQGQVIAKVGSTGNSTGNHCHFEIRKNGTAINPLPFIS